jgi:serine phosphatase RsbU (regulator of sigma subunit)
MLFTDGLYEVESLDQTLYSQTMLLAGVEHRLQARGPDLFDQLLEEIQQFASGRGFTDDVCLVGVEFCPDGVEAG